MAAVRSEAPGESREERNVTGFAQHLSDCEQFCAPPPLAADPENTATQAFLAIQPTQGRMAWPLTLRPP
jgi:hypothetical protein